jgi:hypothetical protein
MKLKDGVIFTQVADETIVVTVGEAAQAYKGMIKLNSTGAFIAQRMLQETTREELVAALRQEYEVDEETAMEAVESIVAKFASVELIKE